MNLGMNLTQGMRQNPGRVNGRFLNNAQPGLVKIIRTWKPSLKTWNGDRDPREVAEQLNINYNTYRRYLSNWDNTFPEPETREILFPATILECFSPGLEASRHEIADILRDKIPYGAEGWRTTLKSWVKEHPKKRGPNAISKATGLNRDRLNGVIYTDCSYPTNMREKLFQFTELPHFRDPQESYSEEKIGIGLKLSFEEIFDAMRFSYTFALSKLGDLVKEKDGPKLAVKVLTGAECLSNTTKANIAAGLFYSWLEVCTDIGGNPEAMRLLHERIEPQDAGYADGLINAIGRGGEELDRWIAFRGYLPRGPRERK